MVSRMTFAFYDLKATGTSPAFDQPVQLAAILTDDAFGMIERVNLRCQIAPHIIPSLRALAVTRVRPAQAAKLAVDDTQRPTQSGLRRAEW